MQPKETLKEFDRFLNQKGCSFSGVIIGGGALSLLGVIARETQDIDVLDPILPKQIILLAQEFAETKNKSGNERLKKDWFNNGPESLRKNLPQGWLKRTELVFLGQSITLYSLGRSDLLKSKLFAFCDREQDRSDCKMLKPTLAELIESMKWVEEQDQNPGWPVHVKASFKSLARELGYEF
ncbi:hypothetical protein K1X76_02090 [bacterium]|nr:hypothetical protein [bacterium]